MRKLFGALIAGMIILVLLPTFILPLVGDVIGIVLASLPWWIWLPFIVAGILVVALVVRLFLPKRHRHDHYHH